MNVFGKPQRTLWLEDGQVCIIDQTALPHRFEILRLRTLKDAISAIADMRVRGAPLIGVTAAYGVALASREDAGDHALKTADMKLLGARPTAVNLAWALERVQRALTALPVSARAEAAWQLAADMAEEDVRACRALGDHGLGLLRNLAQGKRGPLNVLTHCNAGWLATIDWGTALAPVYAAHARGISVHVWVDETRPRNQGAALTAWELAAAGVPCTVITDNAGGLLMRQGKVDVCIVGTDRTTAQGDVCNKIGTYLKALAAKDNNVPFYVAVPTSSIDWQVRATDIPIEERQADEVHFVHGRGDNGEPLRVRVTPDGAQAKNPGFDVTEARLITGLITERGVCSPGDLGRTFANSAARSST